MIWSREKPSHNFIVFFGQSGIISDWECRAKWNPRLLGPGPGGARSPGAPENPVRILED